MNSASMNTDDEIDEAAQSDRACAADSDRLMAEFSIIQSGRYYWYEGYRYEHLAEAVAYAQVIRARHSRHPNPSPITQRDMADPPNDSAGQLMRELSITFENGRFVFEGYQYERLIDAENYARLRRDSGVHAS